LQYYRISLTPSLLDKVRLNIKAGYDSFALFETGKAHGKSQLDQEGLPREYERLAFVYATADKKASHMAGAAYFVARRYLQELLESFGMWKHVKLIPAQQADWGVQPFFIEVAKPFDMARSAVIHDGQRALGIIGEYTPEARKALKLPAYSAGFEFGLNLLQGHAAPAVEYTALPRFPKVTQDITLKIATDVPFSELYDFIKNELMSVKPEDTRASLDTIAIFQRPDDTDHTQVTFRVAIASYEKPCATARSVSFSM